MKEETWQDRLIKKYTRDITELSSAPKRCLTGNPDNLISDISSLLKEQREICEGIYLKENDYSVTHTTLSRMILNAPEPKGEIK